MRVCKTEHCPYSRPCRDSATRSSSSLHQAPTSSHSSASTGGQTFQNSFRTRTTPNARRAFSCTIGGTTEILRTVSASWSFVSGSWAPTTRRFQDNWKENFPASLSLDSVPAKSPYPQPTWTSPPLTLVNFVQPIPRPQLPLPVLDQVDNGDDRPAAPCRVSLSPIPRPSEQREEPEDRDIPAEEDKAVSIYPLC